MENKHQVRPREVLRIRSYLSLDGSDGTSENIAGLPKGAQLAKLLATVKQPEDSWTFSELTLGFYGQPKDYQNMRKLAKEQNGELCQWTPSWPQGNAMNSLCHNFRKKIMKNDGNPHYAFPVRMSEFGGMVKNIIIPLQTMQQFERTILGLRRKRDGIDKTIDTLNKIKRINPKKRAKNTEKAINMMTVQKITRN